MTALELVAGWRLWALSGLPTLPEADVQEADLPIRLRDMDFFFLAVHEQR